jgi:hypothetical protein
VSLGLFARASRVVIPCLPPSFADDGEAEVAAATTNVVCSLTRPDRGRAISDAREPGTRFLRAGARGDSFAQAHGRTHVGRL